MARSRHKSPTCLPAGDRADVAASLYETDLELCTAPALASRLILDGGSSRNRGQGVAPVITGPKTVVADGLVARAAFEAPAEVALTPAEVDALDHAVPGEPGMLPGRTLANCLDEVARLGGYLPRTRDPPPGNTVMWRGWARLADIMLGMELANRRCG